MNCKAIVEYGVNEDPPPSESEVKQVLKLVQEELRDRGIEPWWEIPTDISVRKESE